MFLQPNKTGDYDFTIIVPVYNEEDNMAAVEKRLADYLPTASRRACVLFVNDCSTDNSLALIKDICARNDHFYYISFVRNGGLSAALKAGIDYAWSPLVGYIDSDLQTAPEDFNLLLERADEAELVTGIRADRKDSGFKKLQSKIANGFRRSMTNDGVADTGCPLKVMHTDYAKRVPFFTGMHRFLPALIKLQNGRVIQMPVRHFPRVAGKSKYHLWNRLAGPFKDCFAYRWMRKRYINYDIDGANL
ncbi:MAG: glycosyltransferase [Muribaculaceae bacterium]|nr:glycosyltransferase [Muribaculaceae bacterium]